MGRVLSSVLAVLAVSVAFPVLMCAGVAACLSSPVPNSGAVDASLDGQQQGDAGVDGMPFPGTRQMGIRHVRSFDVDRDGIEDIVIANANDVPSADQGVFVLYGPQSDPSKLRYHQFIQTNAPPHDFQFANVVGGSEPDLVIHGVRSGGGGPGFVELYAQEATGEFSAMLASAPVGFDTTNLNTPILVAVGAHQDAQGNDIFVGNLFTLAVFSMDDDVENELAVTTPTPIGRQGDSDFIWGSINGILPLATPDGVTDDLLIVENGEMTWLRNNGSGMFSQHTNLNSGFGFRTLSEIDLDGEPVGTPPFDIVGGGLRDIGAYRVNVVGTNVSFEALTWNPSNALGSDLTDLVVGDLDGNSSDEVVVFLPDGNPRVVRIFQNARSISPATSVTPIASMDRAFTAINPDQGVMLNFDDDGNDELWVFDAASGQAECIELVGGAPAACDF